MNIPADHKPQLLDLLTKADSIATEKAALCERLERANAAKAKLSAESERLASEMMAEHIPTATERVECLLSGKDVPMLADKEVEKRFTHNRTLRQRQEQIGQDMAAIDAETARLHDAIAACDSRGHVLHGRFLLVLLDAAKVSYRAAMAALIRDHVRPMKAIGDAFMQHGGKPDNGVYLLLSGLGVNWYEGNTNRTIWPRTDTLASGEPMAMPDLVEATKAMLRTMAEAAPTQSVG